MRLERIDVRFYKSFNFDYEHKWHKTTEPAPWEEVSEGWFPFVKLKIDPKVTAIVGANESGKSQLLGAVKHALTGKNINESDFCRYSALYSVESGRVRAPEFGASFVTETNEDLESLGALLPGALVGQRFSLYFPGKQPAFLLASGSVERVSPSEEELALLLRGLPRLFTLDTTLGMPDSMSIAELAGHAPGPLSSRRKRASVVNLLSAGTWGSGAEFAAQFFPSWQSAMAEGESERELRRRNEFELGRKLLVDIARIDPNTFSRLQLAIDGEREGEIEGLVGAMNLAISENLNFQRWWSQDADFEIQVKARERELALVIKDRTKASYSFDERSQGLRYFLSYFVQLAAHRAQAPQQEVMLLDEPDAFLSSLGQHDLLRVLEDYVTPENGFQNQVIYVTHSPFLIDRNAGHRIRVLDKGAEDEGTRVVKDSTQNHYEPLRSALGAAVAETAFIGGANLFVEGMADQVMLSGLNSHLVRARDDADYLDLNEVTIVPSGSADSIPYMVYLARGRDEVKPPCVALLDGDKAGKDAAALLRKGMIKSHRVLSDDCIFEMDVWASTAHTKTASEVVIREIEDLVSLPIAIAAARKYAETIEGVSEASSARLTVELVRQALPLKKGSVWDALLSSYKTTFRGAHIEKVGFAREVVDALALHHKTHKIPDDTEHNFALLLIDLAARLRGAGELETGRRTERRLVGKIREFDRDNPHGIMKRRARALLREIDQVLDNTDNANHIRVELAAISRDHALDQELSQAVTNFSDFQERVRRLPHEERFSGQRLAGEGLRERAD